MLKSLKNLKEEVWPAKKQNNFFQVKRQLWFNKKWTENYSWKFKIKSNSKLNTVEERISKLEDIINKLTQYNTEKQQN